MWDLLTWIAGLLQICVACYALRLNRLFGATRVGWSLFLAFLLLAVFHLMNSVWPFNSMPEFGVRVDTFYGLISLLLLTGMVHIESVLTLRLKLENQLELRVQQKTEELQRINRELQQEVAERKRLAAQMEVTYKELLEASHHAGMTEVATSVIHNVGNVLNSVNISASVVAERLQQSKVPNFTRAAMMIRDHANDLPHFLTTDPQGKQLPAYLVQLAGHLGDERTLLLKEVEFVKKKVEHIKDIVNMQQNYAKIAGITETVMATDLVEDALQMNADALARHDVEILRRYDPDVREITTQKHKVLQILVNLIRNAKYACDESGRKDKRMIFSVMLEDETIRISIQDNGIGIAPENITKIFNHGFTTRKTGHGFGLHGGALAAKELCGRLFAESSGPGQGAKFTLELPLHGQQPRTVNADTSFRQLATAI